jgi:hypothetical protein
MTAEAGFQVDGSGASGVVLTGFLREKISTARLRSRDASRYITNLKTLELFLFRKHVMGRRLGMIGSFRLSRLQNAYRNESAAMLGELRAASGYKHPEARGTATRKNTSIIIE